MKSIIAWSRRSTPIAAVSLIRIVVGGVFLVEGLLKFMFPDELAAGRFAKIGIPAPEFFGPFVGGVEVVCGALVILGLLTRLAVLPLLIDISVALISTKLTVLLGHGFGPFSLMKAPHYGFLDMIHEGRTDLAMAFGLLFCWSLERAGHPSTACPANARADHAVPTSRDRLPSSAPLRLPRTDAIVGIRSFPPPMKSTIVAVLLVLSLGANGLLWYRFAHLQTPGPSDAPHDYPLGENMGYMQRYAEKLWYAGQAGNWDLARYYHDEMQETAEDIAGAHVVKDEVQVSTTLNALLPPVLKELDGAITSHDPVALRTRYQKVIETCNACHVAAKHPFIHIAVPSGNGSQWNQDFTPHT